MDNTVDIYSTYGVNYEYKFLNQDEYTQGNNACFSALTYNNTYDPKIGTSVKIKIQKRDILLIVPLQKKN